jgi:hypothetical protein
VDVYEMSDANLLDLPSQVRHCETYPISNILCSRVVTAKKTGKGGSARAAAAEDDDEDDDGDQDEDQAEGGSEPHEEIELLDVADGGKEFDFEPASGITPGAGVGYLDVISLPAKRKGGPQPTAVIYAMLKAKGMEEKQHYLTGFVEVFDGFDIFEETVEKYRQLLGWLDTNMARGDGSSQMKVVQYEVDNMTGFLHDTPSKSAE